MGSALRVCFGRGRSGACQPRAQLPLMERQHPWPHPRKNPPLLPFSPHHLSSSSSAFLLHSCSEQLPHCATRERGNTKIQWIDREEQGKSLLRSQTQLIVGGQLRGVGVNVNRSESERWMQMNETNWPWSHASWFHCAAVQKAAGCPYHYQRAALLFSLWYCRFVKLILQ